MVVLNKEIQTLYKEKRHSEENKVMKEVKKNPKEFHKHANKHRRCTSKIGPLK